MLCDNPEKCPPPPPLSIALRAFVPVTAALLLPMAVGAQTANEGDRITGMVSNTNGVVSVAVPKTTKLRGHLLWPASGRTCADPSDFEPGTDPESDCLRWVPQYVLAGGGCTWDYENTTHFTIECPTTVTRIAYAVQTVDNSEKCSTDNYLVNITYKVGPLGEDNLPASTNNVRWAVTDDDVWFNCATDGGGDNIPEQRETLEEGMARCANIGMTYDQSNQTCILR